MTRKHFQCAADIVQSILHARHATPLFYSNREHAVFVACTYVQLFSTYNDRFDVARFAEACGLTPHDLEAHD